MTTPSLVSPAIFTIRPAQRDDAEQLHQVCWPDRSIGGVREFLERTQRLTIQRRGIGVVAEHTGTICGFGLLTVWTHAAEISDLIVHPHFRCQGAGTAIITHLVRAAYHLEVEIVEIGALLTNTRAQALYHRLGFTDSRIVQVDLGSGPQNVLYLEKTLA